MSHGKYTAIVILIIPVQFTFDVVPGSAHAISIGTTALDHEIGDHPVKGKSVVETIFGQFNEISTVPGASLSKNSTFITPLSVWISAFFICLILFEPRN